MLTHDDLVRLALHCGRAAKRLRGPDSDKLRNAAAVLHRASNLSPAVRNLLACPDAEARARAAAVAG